MNSISSRTLLTTLLGASAVAAHGHVRNIIINGASYEGFFPGQPGVRNLIAWTTTAQDNGFVDNFQSPDIICHKSATPGTARAQVAAGDKVFLQWDTWPQSHEGPMLDYLASCGSGGCASVQKENLEFFKIDEVGLVTPGSQGTYKFGSDQLVANNNSWMVTIPPNIAPGEYVLRHETIALHQTGQPQAYPQCINLEVTGGGSDQPSGTKGTDLYNAKDPGLALNIYTTLSTYAIPGPTLVAGAVSIEQTSSVATAAGSLIGGGGSGAPATATGGGGGGGSGSPTTAGSGSHTTSKSTAKTSAKTTATGAGLGPSPTFTTGAAAQPTNALGSGGCGSHGPKVRRHARDVQVE